MPAPPADASRCPRGDRVGREPEGDVASPHEGSVVLGPVPDAIRCRVLRMHSRLHIEIMTRRRSRWSTCRPLLAHRAESAHQRLDSQWAAIRSVAEKIGCTAETLRHWVRQAERDVGLRPGLSTEERARMKELEREVRELRRANEILRKASAFFAQAELDRRPREW